MIFQQKKKFRVQSYQFFSSLDLLQWFSPSKSNPKEMYSTLILQKRLRESKEGQNTNKRNVWESKLFFNEILWLVGALFNILLLFEL